MTNIYTLILCFEHEDPEFLGRFIALGQPQNLPSLKKLHLRPVPDEYSLEYEDEPQIGGDEGPWQHSAWAEALCSPHLVHIESLIISIPGLPFWPPTWRQARAVHEEWLGLLPTGSKLKTFVLHCGYVNENGRLTEAEDERDTNLAPSDPDAMPLGLCGAYSTTLWPRRNEYTEVPTLLWKRHCEGGKVIWEEDEEGDAYCGYGEQFYFDGLRVEPGHARVYGYERELFYEAPLGSIFPDRSPSRSMFG
ncbi:hypothetical protein C8R43DRAFT_943595 [Mycena crocata]|nr:hypothetical protein C8R43DRAFT_943595 [Mycena crocata]